MKLPHSHAEPPRPLSLRDKYKAAEWRIWLFYTSLPILWAYMQPEYASHWSLLVVSLRYFSGNLIYSSETVPRPARAISWKQAEQYLFQFINTTRALYGQVHETFHIHLLVHIPRQVLRFGPLWTCSTRSLIMINSA